MMIWDLLGFDILPIYLELERDGMLEISNIKKVFTHRNPPDSEMVNDGEVFADMNVKSHPLLRRRRHMNFLESYQPPIGRPRTRRRSGEEEDCVGPTHLPRVLHVDVEAQRRLRVAVGEVEPDCSAPRRRRGVLDGLDSGGGRWLLGERVGESGVTQAVAEGEDHRAGVETVGPARVASCGVGSHRHVRHWCFWEVALRVPCYRQLPSCLDQKKINIYLVKINVLKIGYLRKGRIGLAYLMFFY